MKRAWLSLLSVAALALPVPALVAQGRMIEPNSGVPFPLRISAPGGGEHILTGTGIRTKTFLQVKVYAFGLYVDSAAAAAALASHAGKDLRALQKDTAFYGDLLKLQFPMTLRLVMTRNVGGEDMADAFDGALRPRVQQAAADMNMPGGEEALDRFRAYFSVGEMTKEAEVLFSCTPDGTLSSRVKGEDKEAIQSPALCWALFDVYLGRKPISGNGKKSLITNFPPLLGTR
ncbi:MAG TPA: chalcone isomerase family protein [Gemmatimonadales bacterium]|nr:chalcone isomerase family protein [Gemmatimonadales bacterium]